MKTIVIDPGHGGYDYGAVNGTRYEKDDNLRISKLIAQKLEACGQKVIMTRNSDVFVPLLDRSYISNNASADLFVSMHRNSSTNPEANGAEVFVQRYSPATTVSYARNVLNQIVNVGVQNNRGVSSDNFSVLRNTLAPSMLVELGFISNHTDNLLFDQNLDAYAAAIVNGILQSLGESCVSPSTPSGPSTAQAIQQTLNNRYGAGLAVDGLFGPQTRAAIIKGLQIELNRSYNSGLTVDGIFGPRTKAAIPNLRRGADNNLVYLLQAMLYFRGYDIAVDGAFGPATENAVRQFQQRSGLVVDGIAGPNTFAALFR